MCEDNKCIKSVLMVVVCIQKQRENQDNMCTNLIYISTHLLILHQHPTDTESPSPQRPTQSRHRGDRTDRSESNEKNSSIPRTDLEVVIYIYHEPTIKGKDKGKGETQRKVQ